MADRILDGRRSLRELVRNLSELSGNQVQRSIFSDLKEHPLAKLHIRIVYQCGRVCSLGRLTGTCRFLHIAQVRSRSGRKRLPLGLWLLAETRSWPAAQRHLLRLQWGSAFARALEATMPSPPPPVLGAPGPRDCLRTTRYGPGV